MSANRPKAAIESEISQERTSDGAPRALFANILRRIDRHRPKQSQYDGTTIEHAAAPRDSYAWSTA